MKYYLNRIFRHGRWRMLWILMVLLTVFTGCGEPTSEETQNAGIGLGLTVEIAKTLPWSEKMGRSIMKRNPEAWQVDFRETPKWNYTQGLVMVSMLKLWKTTGNQAYFDYVKGFADTLLDKDGNILGGYEATKFNIDHIKPGDILFTLYEETQDQRYLTALQTLKRQLEWQPRTTDGGYWHKLRYPWQRWLDGLYMGLPFQVLYANRYDATEEEYNDIVDQFTQMEAHSIDPETGLLYHGWDESRLQRWSDEETGLSQCFWGRAVGWYAMALVEVLEYFPNDHPRRQELVDIMSRLASAVSEYQDEETGLWYQVLDQGDREGNYLEATASVMFVYALAKGFNNGYLPESAKAVAEKGYQGLLKNLVEVDESGEVHLHKCCSVAGLGGSPYRAGDYEYYINEPIRSNDPKGTGPFITASLEMEKMGYVVKQ